MLSTTVLVCAGLLGHFTAKHFTHLVQFITPDSSVYSAQPDWLIEGTPFTPIEWKELIPKDEIAVIQKYQTKPAVTVNDLTQQILNSIEASGDLEYQQTLVSTNTVESMVNTNVKISGFVVPIDFYASKNPKFIFIVPYFGACIHFPPPPPNQMFFVKLEDTFTEFDINQAYTFTGKINIALFEDMLGTSAYSMDVNIIKKFYGEPDTFRNHQN
ncbi:DUF3299 domain-containing protein [Aliiglaciecola sp.]|nr:DUF3299 domain-containing protein [Aliiglaciecola sp.]